MKLNQTDLGFAGAVGDEADGFDSAVLLTQLLQLLCSAVERQPRDKDFVLLHWCVVFEDLAKAVK